MKITRNNYETWFLDYLEGRLNEENREEVKLFLVSHPDLAEELEAFFPAISLDHTIVYPDKALLKKELFNDPAYFETATVAAMEGDLSNEDLHSLENWLAKNPEKQGSLMQMQSTRQIADTAITFPARDRLKKKTSVTSLWIRVAIAAAAAVLLFAFFLFYPEKTERLPENLTTAGRKIHKPDNSVEKNAEAYKSFIPIATTKNSDRRQSAVNKQQNRMKQIISVQSSPERRIADRIDNLKPRSGAVNSFEPLFADLVPVNSTVPVFLANTEIPLSVFLNNKLQELKANGPKGLFTREEFALAGLHLFSRLPGNHLTGRKGTDGRLTSISLNTQLLAISIPVNR